MLPRASFEAARRGNGFTNNNGSFVTGKSESGDESHASRLAARLYFEEHVCVSVSVWCLDVGSIGVKGYTV